MRPLRPQQIHYSDGFPVDVVNHTEFGRALLSFARSQEVEEILLDGTWVAGGCWPFARALRKLVESPSQIWMVVDGSGSPQHVVLQICDPEYGQVYLDGDGIADAEILLERMRIFENLEDPQLRAVADGPMGRFDLIEAGIAELPELDPLLFDLMKKCLPDLTQRFRDGGTPTLFQR